MAKKTGKLAIDNQLLSQQDIDNLLAAVGDVDDDTSDPRIAVEKRRERDILRCDECLKKAKDLALRAIIEQDSIEKAKMEKDVLWLFHEYLTVYLSLRGNEDD